MRDYSEDAIPRGTASGTATPRGDESSFSNVVDVGATNEEKARVLRRHLVSADERGQSTKTSPAPGESSPNAEASGSGSSGQNGADSPGNSAVDTGVDENFPIPYDAPGGDVT